MGETSEVIEVVKWFRDEYPEYTAALRPSMNGISKRGRAGAILWNSMKAQGADAGDLDFALMLPKGGYGGLLIEHKKADGTHKVTDEQQEQIDFHNAIGNCAVSTRGVEAFKAAIVAYLEG